MSRLKDVLAEVPSPKWPMSDYAKREIDNIRKKANMSKVIWRGGDLYVEDTHPGEPSISRWYLRREGEAGFLAQAISESVRAKFGSPRKFAVVKLLLRLQAIDAHLDKIEVQVTELKNEQKALTASLDSIPDAE